MNIHCGDYSALKSSVALICGGKRSVKFRCELADVWPDHLAVNCFDLRDSLYDIWCVLFLSLLSVNGVAEKQKTITEERGSQNVFDFGELATFS